jgi:hypothetical protein
LGDPPVAEKNRLLARVVQGEAARVRIELLRSFHSDTTPTIPAPTRLTVAALLDAAAQQRVRPEASAGCTMPSKLRAPVRPRIQAGGL